MKKRLPKKRHLGEFQELGFELTFRILSSKDTEQETDRLFEVLEASDLFDVWYGELPSESEKPEPNRLIATDRNPRGARVPFAYFHPLG